MKSKDKNLVILLASIVIIACVVFTSFLLESRSQKLPAVVRSEEVFVSCLADGIVRDYQVEAMQQVEKGDIIVQLQNDALINKQKALQIEKERYLELINSAQNGDALQLELSKLEKAILDNRLELQETSLKLLAVTQRLLVATPRIESITKQYKANKSLYDESIISANEFKNISEQYDDNLSDYNELKYDSLYAEKKINTIQSIIQIQESQINIISGNPSVLAAEALIDLDNINAQLLEVEDEINHLKIVSPIRGIITDINYQPGETVKDGDVIAEIADLKDIWITAYGNSFSRKNIVPGCFVRIYANNSQKITGSVKSVSPVMEKVKALSSSFETANTYLKIEIDFDDPAAALENLTPGERLFVRIFLNS
ncbi:MAG: HlyD family efflux transporter periplasmic adaptor subunit [Candidatus Cloacimonetes bacterium]|nr:HlyD family efflux transporter periplasmic adaptor subunit [Candidatus Cloacimonadota bacterium]